MLSRLGTYLRISVKKGSFLSHFFVLAGGTALAQLLPVLASPLFTRLYSPADFGLLAIFMAMVSTFTPAVCGKYEVAMVVPKDNVHGQHLFGIAIYFALFLSIALSIILFFAGDTILFFLHAESLQKWSYLVPVALFFTGMFTAVSYFSNRQKKYSLLAQSKILKGVVLVLVTVAFGLLTEGFIGLLVGYLISLLATTIFLVFRNYSEFTPRVMHFGQSKKKLFYQYADYPLYNASTGFLNGLTLSLPIFFLSRYFPETIVGYFALVVRVSRAPIGFISASISQIHLKKTVDLVNQGSPVTPYLLKLTFFLIAAVALPSLITIFWAPDIFALVFGKEWAAAGRYAQILMPSLAVSFVTSTLSTTLGATKNNQLTARWRIVAFVTTLAVLAWFAPKGNILILLYAMSINDIILYFFYYILIWSAAKRPRNFSCKKTTKGSNR